MPREGAQRGRRGGRAPGGSGAEKVTSGEGATAGALFQQSGEGGDKVGRINMEKRDGVVVTVSFHGPTNLAIPTAATAPSPGDKTSRYLSTPAPPFPTANFPSFVRKRCHRAPFSHFGPGPPGTPLPGTGFRGTPGIPGPGWGFPPSGGLGNFPS